MSAYPRRSARASLLGLALAAILACQARPAAPRKQAPKVSQQKTPATPSSGRFTVDWSPLTGKGLVVERLASGDELRTCFHCKYPGYTGGLVIGSMDGSGMEFRPRRPLRGFSSINLFCAQDESIWDLDENVEYTYGWSENYGTGPDGKRLEYRGGKVLRQSGDEIALASENAGGCYRVLKVALTRAESLTWFIATRIENRCDHPVRFHFFTGDDPWLGLYASSDGDVGWTPEGLIRNATVLDAGRLTVAGFYDLGNQALGQKEEGFSNQADFFALDPALPLPDFAAFANRFAHEAREVDARRPLDNKSMIALNLGWTKRHLAAGESLDVTLALGMAATGEPGTTPRPPSFTDEDWSRWRSYMKPTTRDEAVRFAAERVELDLHKGLLTVDATYHLHNPSSASQALAIAYPILVSRKRLSPETVEVDGRALRTQSTQPGQVVVDFPVEVPPWGLRSFHVRYRQPLRGREAVYLVTSALRWPSPIERAVFLVRHPSNWSKVTVSYPISHSETKNRQTTHTIVRQPFVPDREFAVHWGGE
jgi:hypothetical protein